MCEHCEALSEVLTECAGKTVAAAVLKRVQPRLHPAQLKIESCSRTEVTPRELTH